MNFGGAFSFSGLIKTILPGFLLVLAVFIAADIFFTDAESAFTEHFPKEYGLFSVVIFSLLLGILLTLLFS